MKQAGEAGETQNGREKGVATQAKERNEQAVQKSRKRQAVQEEVLWYRERPGERKVPVVVQAGVAEKRNHRET